MQGDSIWLSTHRNICVRKGLLDNQVLTIPASPRMESSTISCSVPPKGLQPPHHPRGPPREGTPRPSAPRPCFYPSPPSNSRAPAWLAGAAGPAPPECCSPAPPGGRGRAGGGASRAPRGCQGRGAEERRGEEGRGAARVRRGLLRTHLLGTKTG